VQHAQPVALLSYSFWKRQFAGDPRIVGRTINLSNNPVTVIGVLPNTFDFGSVFSPGAKVDLFAPYIMENFRNDGNDLALIGRLKTGVSPGTGTERGRCTISSTLFRAPAPRVWQGLHRPAYWIETVRQRQTTAVAHCTVVHCWPDFADRLRESLKLIDSPGRSARQGIRHAQRIGSRSREARASMPADPVTFAATLIVLLAVAMVGGYLPAQKASRIDPMVALRTS
jgi:hypothetical protein